MLSTVLFKMTNFKTYGKDTASGPNNDYNTVWSEFCECIRANSLQTVL